MGKPKNKKVPQSREEKSLERESKTLSEIVDFLVKIGMRNVNVYPGTLRNPERKPYIEFRFSENTPDKKVQDYLSKRCELRKRIQTALTQNLSEVEGIETQQPFPGVYREYLKINPEAQFDKYSETQIRRGVLEIISTELRNYRQRN